MEPSKVSDASLRARLRAEEFAQMHQHLRQREEAMNQLLNLTATGATTLLAAIAAFVFQAATASPERVLIWHCYLFLLPVPLIIFGLSMLSAHRDDIFKMGYYIKVFFEDASGGPAWHIRLEPLRRLGESQDPALMVMWSLFAVATTLFAVGLSIVEGDAIFHLLTIVPLFAWMVMQHSRFMRKRQYIECAWRSIREQEEQAASSNLGRLQNANTPPDT